MSMAGYYRFPTIHADSIVFVSEDDLWQVSAGGGVAQRLTSNRGEATYPMLSPDGSQLAFVGNEEGSPEIYVMPAKGGPARRLTFLSSNCRVLGWDQRGEQIIFTSSYGQAMRGEMHLFQVTTGDSNGTVTELPFGPARSITFGADGQVVLGRNIGDPARWKRYRGGTAGHLWVDREGDGQFERFLANLAGNIVSPMWVEGEAGDGADPRIFFVSDHQGIGNLYSCTPAGDDLRRHTDHEDYYVRNPATDGKRIVYHAGADLFLYDMESGTSTFVPVEYHSPRIQRNRKFVHAARYVGSVGLHPTGEAIALDTRGKAFAFFNFDGPVLQLGQRDGVRYRLTEWLNDGQRLVTVSDDPGEEVLEIHAADLEIAMKRLDGLDIGRPVALKVSPVEDKVAIANHRHELLVVDLESGQLTVADRSPHRRIAGFDWSPDGRWLAYGYSATPQTTEIRLIRVLDGQEVDAGLADTPETDADEGEAVETNEAPQESAPAPIRITKPVLHDTQPVFDPTGRYLYFISAREFNPVYDGLHFDLGFPWGMRPYLVTLRADLPNPFIPHPELDGQDQGNGNDDEDQDEDQSKDVVEDKDGDGEVDGDAAVARASRKVNVGPPAPNPGGDLFAGIYSPQFGGVGGRGRRQGELDDAGVEQPVEANIFEHAIAASEKEDEKKKDEKRSEKKGNQTPLLRIDLEGIERRVLAFPVADARYVSIAAVKDKALFIESPIQGTLDSDNWDDEDEADGGVLRAYDFKEFKSETLVEGVRWFDISRNREKLLYASGQRMRVINAGEKPPTNGGHPRKTGWLDLNRVKVSVDPQSEWEQMFREAWRLQRDHFWNEDMSQVDWQRVFTRYFPLIERVSSRGEFSDLMWEMQGELGTSHAYEFGGDYRPRPHYGQGFLGASLTWDAEAGGYRVGEPVIGDVWDSRRNSPLADPGVDVLEGDLLLAINGQPLDETTTPGQLLVNQAGQQVLLTFAVRASDADEVNDEVGDETDDAAAEADAPETTAPEANVPETDSPADADANNDNAEASDEPRTRGVVVRTLMSETPARYRALVEHNRRRVHEASDGQVGYVHIPDMGPRGYAEFHRGYLAEIDRDSLIVDVRYNGGGHVSQLILEKLARRRLGYDLSRWGGMMPYPAESVAGPLVAITDEHAGSDGDIFSHSFKMMKLGPLIGKRTWGGVIGIWPRHALVDGTVTTQPEYSFWFEDMGWNVENYGTDPDIEVDISPQDYVAGDDPQLERAIEEALRLLAETPIVKPDLAARPSRALPSLPPRK